MTIRNSSFRRHHHQKHPHETRTFAQEQGAAVLARAAVTSPRPRRPTSNTFHGALASIVLLTSALLWQHTSVITRPFSPVPLPDPSLPLSPPSLELTNSNTPNSASRVVEEERALAAESVMTTRTTTQVIGPITTVTTIPHRLIFTHQKNILETKEPILFYENIQRAMALYQQAWNQTTLDVWFLDDAACRQVLQETEQRLVDHFERENRGAFKSDICRIAALYQRGGYYLDCDLVALEPVDLAPAVTFATVLMDRKIFFQAFTAAVPGDAILRRALTIMADYYDESWIRYQAVTQGQPSPVVKNMNRFRSVMRRYHQSHSIMGLLGPSTLRDAYDQVLGIKKAGDEAASAVSYNYTGQIRLLREARLGAHRQLYPHLSRQKGGGALCNYIVHDPDIPQAYFFSRFPGASSGCQKNTP